MTIGLTMIVKNESETLPRLLEQISPVVDEIVIADTGSTDGTKREARRFTDKVFDFEWSFDFAAARNYSLQQVRSDYFLWLDADDTVPPATLDYIIGLKRKRNFDADAVMMPYIVAPGFSFYRERIIKNDGKRWTGAVHEAVPISGKIVYSRAEIVHAKPSDRSNGTRNLDIYRRLIADGKLLSPRERYYYARELYYNDLIADAAHEFEKFIDSDGFIPNKIDACVLLARCYKRLSKPVLAMYAALAGLQFGRPSAELCCTIGELFFDQRDFLSAAYWYGTATKIKDNGRSGAFVDKAYSDFIPYVWLSVCYDKLGDEKRAYAYHLRAKKLRPDDKSVKNNDVYFCSRGLPGEKPTTSI